MNSFSLKNNSKEQEKDCSSSVSIYEETFLNNKLKKTDNNTRTQNDVNGGNENIISCKAVNKFQQKLNERNYIGPQKKIKKNKLKLDQDLSKFQYHEMSVQKNKFDYKGNKNKTSNKDEIKNSSHVVKKLQQESPKISFADQLKRNTKDEQKLINDNYKSSCNIVNTFEEPFKISFADQLKKKIDYDTPKSKLNSQTSDFQVLFPKIINSENRMDSLKKKSQIECNKNKKNTSLNPDNDLNCISESDFDIALTDNDIESFYDKIMFQPSLNTTVSNKKESNTHNYQKSFENESKKPNPAIKDNEIKIRPYNELQLEHKPIELNSEEIKMLDEVTIFNKNPLIDIFGYIPQDEKRICRFAKDGTCFKGNNCRLSHEKILPTGYTRDKCHVFVYNSMDPVYPAVNEPFEVIPTVIQQCGYKFYGQIVSDYQQDLFDLMKRINSPEELKKFKHYPEALIPAMLELILAKWDDGIFYRARIIEYLENDLVSVFFLDYGNNHIVNVKDIRQWHPQLDYVPFLALEFTISGIMPKKEKLEELKQYWSEFLIDKRLKAVAENTIDSIYVNLHNCINQCDVASELKDLEICSETSNFYLKVPVSKTNYLLPG